MKPRQVTINVHLRDADTGRCDTTRAPITVEQVRSWCTHPDTQVIIRPIRDLNDHVRVDAYEVPDRLADQVDERDGTCIHPWCTRPARAATRTTASPTTAAAAPAATTSRHFCRAHHRAKTHGSWTLPDPPTRRLPVDRSPDGHWYYRDGTGTTDLGRLTPD